MRFTKTLRIITCLTALMMMLTAFSGCGGNDAGNETGTEQAGSSAASENTAKSETEAGTEADTAAPAPVLEGATNIEKLRNVMKKHSEALDKLNYTLKSESTDVTSMTLGGEKIDNTEKRVENTVHRADGAMSTSTAIDDYTSEEVYVDGVYYCSDEWGKVKVNLTAGQYAQYLGESGEGIDEFFDAMLDEDITIVFDSASKLFNISFKVSDEARLKAVFEQMMGEEDAGVKLSDLTLEGSVTATADGLILNDSVKLSYTADVEGMVMTSSTASEETYTYPETVEIKAPADADAYELKTVEEYFESGY